ncbi:diacylglycerol kinase theta [Cocos nucifera]|uniref:Diacylglycerol kinase theta n=1 Tax=Cocos nucifera TaxID=13894 RepID=A0A8K0INS2_COCNU|nr:diacylglycerol kinase theta [Cocos nucifera]
MCCSLAVKKSPKSITRSPSMDLPTIPKTNPGEEIFHFSHPQHPLVQVSYPYLFTCMGCKEYGAGKRFRCQICGFDLHDFCALAPPSLHGHPLHHKHQLVFFTKPGGFLRSKCDICNKSTKGFAFRCSSCSFEMHPCCAAMSRQMKFLTHQHPLTLSSPMAIMGGDSSFVCEVCQRKRSGQVYCCIACGYYLHAVCAKDLINGLHVHGIRPPEKSNMLGAAAKLASHALFGIIGGLIEGIGEGIGEALMDNLGNTRSRGIRTK